MGELKLFWEFNKISFCEIQDDKKTYLSSFFALVLLSNIESFFPVMGVVPESNTFIALSIFSTLAIFVILSKIVLIQKIKKGGTGELMYIVPSFLLYNLYYSFLFFGGIFLFIIPGFYSLIFFSLVPYVAVLDDECQGSYFKESKLLVKKNIKLVAWASIINLVVELLSLSTSLIQNSSLKALTNFIFSIPYALVTMVLTVTFVKVYYFLKEATHPY